MDELLQFVPYALIVGAVMEGVKKTGLVPKKWYVLAGVIVSAVMAVIVVMSMGWSWGVFIGAAIVITLEQAGIDWMVFKPLLKKLMKKK